MAGATITEVDPLDQPLWAIATEVPTRSTPLNREFETVAFGDADPGASAAKA
ncbi:hypothetical protein SBF1_5300003 [Candidatus Desulfosporosinus infrequens]|uniref:Uncharacterized protein n=1 Tax=Candidatus Desulfosporosinus infrequens TaxID=2043169 RepID=A0A2U3LID6_9FIRM|nr:hypothetical protein SBF1_5300003 [Candidatus Desulfosporosinus infrequens]